MHVKKTYILLALFFLQSNTLADDLEIKFFKSNVVKKIIKTTPISTREWNINNLLENKYLNLMANLKLKSDSHRERNPVTSFFLFLWANV